MLLLSSSSKKQLAKPPYALTDDDHNALLIELVDAALSNSPDLPAARAAVSAAMGAEAVVDVAGVVGAFHAYNRIVDATGVPLDDVFSAVTEDLQKKHGYEQFSSKRKSDISALLSTVQRVSAPVARWLFRKGMEQARRVM